MTHEPMYYIQKYRRPLIMWGVVSIVLLIACSAAWQYHLAEERKGKIAVPVQVVPSDAIVSISSGKTLPSRGDAYIKPGEYTVSVKADGFYSYTGTLRVSESALPYIYVGLEGKTKEAKQWQAQNSGEYDAIEKLTVTKSREYSDTFDRANPIIADLPIKDPYYSVGYRNDNDTSVELIIWGTSPANRAAALEMLREKGYDPTNYRVIYEGFDNPLGDKK